MGVGRRVQMGLEIGVVEVTNFAEAGLFLRGRLESLESAARLDDAAAVALVVRHNLLRAA